MLLGVYGMFAVGKTTFLDNFKDDLADRAKKPLTIVLADISTEYWLRHDKWRKRRDKPIYKGSREDKVDHMEFMVADTSRIWIVESARYFGGCQDLLVDCFKKYHGGLAFIIITSYPETAQKFLMERCEKRNKEYRADYWTKDRLIYESEGRYMNVVNNAYRPAGVPVYTFKMDYLRREWDAIGETMLDIVSHPDRWYNENSSNQGHKRQREDYHSQAAVVRVPRR